MLPSQPPWCWAPFCSSLALFGCSYWVIQCHVKLHFLWYIYSFIRCTKGYFLQPKWESHHHQQNTSVLIFFPPTTFPLIKNLTLFSNPFPGWRVGVWSLCGYMCVCVCLGAGELEGTIVVIHYKKRKSLYISKSNIRCQILYHHIFLKSSWSVSKGETCYLSTVFILKEYLKWHEKNKPANTCWMLLSSRQFN